MPTTRLLLLFALLLAACRREEVTHFRIAKSATAAKTASLEARRVE